MTFLRFGFLGGAHGAGTGALLVAKKPDGTDAVFPDFQALKAFYTTNPKPKFNEAAVIGTADANGNATNIQNGYIYKNGKWEAVVANFEGDKGDPGPRGEGMQMLDDIPDYRLVSVVNGKLVDSHVESKDRILYPLDNEIQLGVESLIGSGETLLIFNKSNREIRSPIYQIVGPNVETANVRTSGSLNSKTYPDNGDELVNPEYTITFEKNITIYSAHVKVVQPITNVVVEIFANNYTTQPAWNLFIPNMKAGLFELPFNKTPIMLKKGVSYQFKFSSPDGDVILKGDAGTGIIYSELVINEWYDVELATKNWVNLLFSGAARVPNPITLPSVVTHISFDDDGNMIVTYNGGAKQKISASSFGGGGNPPALDDIKNEIKTLENTLKSQGVDLDALKKEMGTVEHKVGQFQSVFNYRGTTMPTFPNDPKSAYFLNFYGSQAKSETLNLPAPSTDNIKPGAIVYVANEDINTSIRVRSSTGSIDGAYALNVPPGNFLLIAKKTNGWQKLADGFIPSSMKRIESDIKNTLLKDQGELTSLASDLAPALEKLGFTKGTTGGVTLINPDGSRHTVTDLKLVDMKVVDPGDGSTPKLVHINQHSGNPKPSTTSAYAFFSPSPTAPEKSSTFTSLPVYRDGKVSVHKDTSDPQYIYILLPPGEGDDVQRVGEQGGLPAYWAKQSKSYPNNGQDRTYTVLRSPYKFHENDVTLILYP